MSGTWLRETGTELIHVSKSNGEWEKTAEVICSTSLNADILYFGPPVLWKGELKSKGGGKKTIHNNGSEETVEMILRAVISPCL